MVGVIIVHGVIKHVKYQIMVCPPLAGIDYSSVNASDILGKRDSEH